MVGFFVQVIFFLALFLASLGTAYADVMADFYSAYNRHDYDSAARILRAAAEANDPKAQDALGVMYFFALPGVKPDVAEGMRLLRAAAENNVVRAQIVLADAYESGRKVPKDLSE